MTITEWISANPTVAAIVGVVFLSGLVVVALEWWNERGEADK